MTIFNSSAELAVLDQAEIERVKKEIYGNHSIARYLGRTGTSKYDRENDTEGNIVRHVDITLLALGIEPANWFDNYTRTTHPWQDEEEFLEEEKAALKRNPLPLGKYLLRRAFDGLPIESDECGDSSVNVELTLQDGYKALFHATGSYWTDYLYRTLSKDDSRSMDELTEDGIEPEDSSAEFTIEAELRLMSPEASR